jgi:protein involved in polysaccharide export with SLBB domain
MYKLEPNLTVLQAISLAGGVTPKGSDRRVEIKRALARTASRWSSSPSPTTWCSLTT